MTPIKFGVGQSVLRKEDDALIRGKGRYTDDYPPSAVMHALVLRSPHAHAKFAIDATRARGLPSTGQAGGHSTNSIRALAEAQKRGFDETILRNDRVDVAEGSGENIFVGRDGVLITNDADADILPGVTRASAKAYSSCSLVSTWACWTNAFCSTAAMTVPLPNDSTFVIASWPSMSHSVTGGHRRA